MEPKYNYFGEDKIQYTIRIHIEEDNSLTLSIEGPEINDIYSSNYLLDNLN